MGMLWVLVCFEWDKKGSGTCFKKNHSCCSQWASKENGVSSWDALWMHLQQIKVAVQTVTWKTDYKQANKVLTRPKNWNSAGAKSLWKLLFFQKTTSDYFLCGWVLWFFSRFYVYIPQMCCILLIKFAVWKHSEIHMCIKYHFTSTSSSLRYCASSAAKWKRSVQSNTTNSALKRLFWIPNLEGFCLIWLSQTAGESFISWRFFIAKIVKFTTTWSGSKGTFLMSS